MMCHHTLVEPTGDEEVVVADIADLAAVERACEGIYGVVHLAATAKVVAPWDVVLQSNIIGTYNVFEAAQRQGASRIVFASSNHATGWYEREGVYTTPDMPARPDSYYGTSKAFGEDLGRYYADEFGIGVVSLRIGSFQPKPRNARMLATWLSYRDCAQLVLRGLESDVRHGVYYGISGNTRRYWDISNAQAELGYAPEDDAEAFAAEFAGEKLPPLPAQLDGKPAGG
jgi:uronate dehydrogenase